MKEKIKNAWNTYKYDILWSSTLFFILVNILLLIFIYITSVMVKDIVAQLEESKATISELEGERNYWYMISDEMSQELDRCFSNYYCQEEDINGN